MKTTIDLLCQLRAEVRDWQHALSGEREGLDDLCGEVDAKIAALAAEDGYACRRCNSAVPHDSSSCPHCAATDAAGAMA